MTAEWVPFGLTDDETERYKVLVDGVPQKLREPLIAWLKHLLAGEHDRLINSRTRHLELLSEIHMGVQEDAYIKWPDYTQVLRTMEAQSLLKVVDAALAAGW